MAGDECTEETRGEDISEVEILDLLEENFGQDFDFDIEVGESGSAVAAGQVVGGDAPRHEPVGSVVAEVLTKEHEDAEDKEYQQLFDDLVDCEWE